MVHRAPGHLPEHELMPYLGEIRMFAGGFAPLGWELCDGRILPIAEHDALFQLIGTTYGGDGQETFALPDLQGRVPIHMGTGPGGVTYQLAETGGVEEVTLTVQQIPAHTHALLASRGAGNTANASGNVPAASPSVDLYIQDSPSVALPANTLGPSGGSQPHSNLMPHLAVTFIINTSGVFPTQT
jgi:microcystin-dependent protein